MAGPATLVLLVLLFLDSTIFVGPLRDSLRLVGLNPARWREGLAIAALLYPILLVVLAWREKSVVLSGLGRSWRIAYGLLFAAYALSVWLPALLAADRSALSFYRVLQVLLVPLNIAAFAFLLPAVLDRAGYQRILRAIVIVSVGFGILSLVWVMLNAGDSFLGIPLSQPPDERGGRWAASGFFVHRNTIGSILVGVIPAATLLALVGLRRAGTAGLGPAGLAVLLLLGWLVVVFSRSSQLGVAAAAGVAALAWAWLARPASPAAGRVQRTVRIGTVIGAAALVLLGVSLPWLLPRIAPGLDATLVETLNGRVLIWTDIWDQTEGHRWLGAGLFGIQAIGPGGVEYGEVYAPHNAFLAQLAYFGLPGLVSLGGLLAAFLVEGWRRRRSGFGLEDAVMLGTLAGIIVQNQFEFVLTYPVLLSNSVALLLFGVWRAGLRIAPAGTAEDAR